MKRINFKEISVETSIDVFQKQDLAKQVGEALHKKATTLALDELARKIFKSTGPIELEDNEFTEMMAALDGVFYLFFIQGIANSAEDFQPTEIMEE